MQPQPHSSLLNNISRPNTQHPTAFSPPAVIPDRLLSHPAASSSIPPPSFRQAMTILTAEANARATAPNLTSAPSQTPLDFPHPAPAVLPPSRAQIQHRHSYPPSMDARVPGPSIRVDGAGTSALRPSAQAGTNTPSIQPPNLPTSTQSVSISAHPATHKPPTAPLPAPPPEIASLLHPSVDLAAIQHKLEGSLSQVGVNLGAIWRHIVETTTLEAAKHRSDTLRWKERCLHFEEMYKNCKQKLDNINHENIMLHTQISRFQAELTRAREQRRSSPRVMRSQGAFGQDHLAHERARILLSLQPTPASAVKELPQSPSHITPLREKLVIDLSGDREDTQIEPPQSEKLGQNEPSSALCITEGPHPVLRPTTAVRQPTPPEHSTTPPPVTTSQASPEVSTRVTTSPKSSRVTPPSATHSISGFLSSKPSSAIRTVTPVKPRSNVNNSTLTMTPMPGTLPIAVVPPVQTTKPAAISVVDEPEEELEEGEVKNDSPMASPVNGKTVRNSQLPLQSHAAVRAEPAKNAPPHSDSVPPLSLYLKPNQRIPLIPKKIPKKRPFETGEDGPIKRARPALPPSTMGLPQRQIGMGSRSTTAASSRPGTVERSSTQGSEGIPKLEPKSPVLPPNTSASSRSKSTEIAVGMVKPPYEDTAVTASDPPPGYVSSQKEELGSLITKELRRRDELIYCHPCVLEYESNPSKPVTRFTGQQSVVPHVLYHFESQHREWWEKVQANASNPASA